MVFMQKADSKQAGLNGTNAGPSYAKRLGAFALNLPSLSLLLPLLLASSWSNALVEMEEEQMASVTGTGLAFVFDDFSFRMAPTSYVELTGDTPTLDAQAFGWRNGDARYYGISMTSGSSLGTDWYASDASGTGCSGGTLNSNLSCPIGVGSGDFGVDAFASIYDPFVLRVFEYQGFNYGGGWLDQAAGTGTGSYGSGGNTMPSVLEFRGPVNSDDWRWSFWGELEIDNANDVAPDGSANNAVVGTGGADFLQSQSIILGKPVASDQIWDRDTDSYITRAAGPHRAVQRWMHTTHTAANERTFGVTYDSALSGDFRFSVRQNAGSPDALHYVPDFQDTEGMYFRNVDAFFPLGTLHYQALTFSGVSEYYADGSKRPTPSQHGDFSIELTQIPNDPNVYGHFYCGNTDGSECADASGYIDNPNPDTHGFVRWGDWSAANTATGAGLPGATDTTNGIYFIGGANASDPTSVVNIGISRIEGMLIHHLKITSLGAGS